MSGLAYLPYYAALRDEPPENAILVWNIVPALVALGAWLFLGEALTAWQYGGIALLVLSSLVAEYAPNARRRAGWRRAARMMLLSSLFIAAQMIGMKFVFGRAPYATAFAWISLGSLALGATLLLRAKTRSALAPLLKNVALDRRIIGNQLLDVAAISTKAYATSIGPVSLVQSVEGVQPLFVMLLAATLFKRKRTRGQTVRVVAATALAIVGLWMV